MRWQSKILSFGDRHLLIAHIIQPMPIYLLSAINPPKGVINRLYQLMAKLFLGRIVGVKGKHWVSCDTMCYPLWIGDWALDPFLKCQEPYLRNYGGTLE